MTKQFALIRAGLNSSEPGEIVGEYTSESGALRAGENLIGTTGEIGLYVAQRKADGRFEGRLEARDRRESTQHL